MKLADAGCTGFAAAFAFDSDSLIQFLLGETASIRDNQSLTDWLTVCLFSAFLTDWLATTEHCLLSVNTAEFTECSKRDSHEKRREKKRSTDSRSVYNLYSYIRMKKVRFQSVYPSVFPSLILKFSDCLKLLSLSVLADGSTYCNNWKRRREKRTRVKNWRSRAEHKQTIIVETILQQKKKEKKLWGWSKSRDLQWIVQQQKKLSEEEKDW